MRIFGLKKRIDMESDREVDDIDPNEKKIMDAYRATFMTGPGKRTLDELLWSLYFFSTAVNDEQRIRQNVAREILNKLGIFNEAKSGEIVDKLLQITTLLVEDKSAGT